MESTVPQENTEGWQDSMQEEAMLQGGGGRILGGPGGVSAHLCITPVLGDGTAHFGRGWRVGTLQEAMLLGGVPG